MMISSGSVDFGQASVPNTVTSFCRGRLVSVGTGLSVDLIGAGALAGAEAAGGGAVWASSGALHAAASITVRIARVIVRLRLFVPGVADAASTLNACRRTAPPDDNVARPTGNESRRTDVYQRRRESAMSPLLIAMTLLGCSDAGDQCQTLRVLPARYVRSTRATPPPRMC